MKIVLMTLLSAFCLTSQAFAWGPEVKEGHTYIEGQPEEKEINIYSEMNKGKTQVLISNVSAPQKLRLLQVYKHFIVKDKSSPTYTIYFLLEQTFVKGNKTITKNGSKQAPVAPVKVDQLSTYQGTTLFENDEIVVIHGN